MNELLNLSFYSFFTKYSLMEDYGFSSGLRERLFRKILPSLPEEGSFELFVLRNQKNIEAILDEIPFRDIEDSIIAKDLDLSIKALCSKIAAFGLDNNIYTKYRLFNLESESFEKLLGNIAFLENKDSGGTENLLMLLEQIEINVHTLRKLKRRIGVKLHLTMATRRILEYIERAKELVDLKLNLTSEDHWRKLIEQHIQYIKKKDSIRRFVIRHIDLLVLEVVEHTSNQGEKYIAENAKEYRRFFYQSMLGGAIIALFALGKIYFGTFDTNSMGDAILFSLNYAICFILAKQLGGIIATKQPSMTASTIAKQIDQDDNLEIDSIRRVVVVIRKALGSQFISLVGNFFVALIFAIFISKILELAGLQNSVGIQGEYLIADVMPGMQLVKFAAFAGFFLSFSGLISGYIDNKIIASKVAFRISNSKLFFKSNKLANLVKTKGGAFTGNLSLGFFLGSAFLVSYISPFAVDIRHIAFSSSNVGYAIMNQSFDLLTILKALSGVILIGFTNLIVSFSITLLLALKSRGAKLSLIPKLLFHSLKDFMNHPIEYFVVRNPKM